MSTQESEVVGAAVVRDHRAASTIVAKPVEPIQLPATATNPIELMSQALARGATPEMLEKLMALQERWEANNARKAFVAAMAAFKAEPIEILKSKFVNIPGGAKFKHATLADVVDAVVPAMGRHGLSHRWDVVQTPDTVTVTCVITHALGHSEQVTMFGPPDTSGKKNIIQENQSTVTYLQRHTLMAVCGVAARDVDDDGAAGATRGTPDAPPAPDGFDDWKSDMEALVDQGTARVMKGFNDGGEVFRRHVTRHFTPWWNELKAKAAQADKRSKAQQ